MVATHINLDHAFTDLVHINTTGKKAVLQATANHPFWSKDRQAWVEAADLKNNENLVTIGGGSPAVTTTTSYTGSNIMYDLTIDTTHTYYVLAGNAPVLVHNCGPDLDAMSAAGRAPDKGGSEAAARAYQKHMDRGELPRVAGKDLKLAGRDLLDDILTDPHSDFQSITQGGFKGGTRVTSNRIESEQFVGAVYDSDGAFRYFGLFS